MSCIANFYLDGIKYSLEDYDMDKTTTKMMLKRVISAAEKPVKEEVAQCDHNDLLKQLNCQPHQVLCEEDDEELLNSL
jgi:hypothetical protein